MAVAAEIVLTERSVVKHVEYFPIPVITAYDQVRTEAVIQQFECSVRHVELSGRQSRRSAPEINIGLPHGLCDQQGTIVVEK